MRTRWPSGEMVGLPATERVAMRQLRRFTGCSGSPPRRCSAANASSSVATGMKVHAFTEAGLTLFDDEPDVPEPESTELDELATTSSV